MPDFEDHNYVLEELQKAQDVDQDNREAAREADLFIDKRNGQWEPFWWDRNIDKPRYQFDLTTPLINQIAGKIAKADFAGDVEPIGGEASKEVAETLDGMVRNIQSLSGAEHIYKSSARGMITRGIDGWEIVQKFIDGDSFDQDLVIQNVENFVDRVWFNVSAEKQDRSDATMAWKFTGFTPEDYKKKWPNGSEQSLGDDRQANAYFDRPDLVMVGEFYYVEEEERELVLMSNDAVYEDDDKFKSIADDLRERFGVVEVRRRKRKHNVVYSRKMDANGWLEDKVKTVFDFIPLIPVYGNYKISENKTIYYGAVEKRLDAQRVFNYSMSRQIEEGSLAPRAKYWMTTDQAKGHADTLTTMNVNSDPVQLYEPDPQAPNPPQQSGGAQINPGLKDVSQVAGSLITETAGLFAANLGDNPNAQSGVAIDSLKDQGDVGTISYFEATEIPICHTMRILIKAIPKVYVGRRQARLLREDGSFKMVTLNDPVTDAQTGEEVVLNDLSVGTYSVTCSSGPAFQNRQQETVSAMVEIGQVDPSIIELGGDILLNNVTAPGMDMIADRKRAMLFQQGMIPQDQWTEEEAAAVRQAQIAAQNQPPQQTPEEMIGQAELIKAQNEQAETQIGVEEKSAKIQLAQQRENREDAKVEQDIKNDQIKQLIDVQKMQMEQSQSLFDEVKSQAETLKIIKDAMGVDTIVGPSNMEAYTEQTEQLLDSQDQINRT